MPTQMFYWLSQNLNLLRIGRAQPSVCNICMYLFGEAGISLVADEVEDRTSDIAFIFSINMPLKASLDVLVSTAVCSNIIWASKTLFYTPIEQSAELTFLPLSLLWLATAVRQLIGVLEG